MSKEKFYNLLQELVHYEVGEALREQNNWKDLLKNVETYLDNQDQRLGELEGRYAKVARSIFNDGK